MKKIAVYCGSFDPPHKSHVRVVVEQILENKFDKILIVPSGNHPDKNNIVDFNHRYEMCLKAFGFIKGIEVSRIECDEFSDDEITYTYNVVKKLKENIPGDYTFIMGSDLFHEVAGWYRYDDLKELVDFAMMYRDLGSESSTKVRNVLKNSGHCDKLKEMLPFEVYNYIKEKDLYR